MIKTKLCQLLQVLNKEEWKDFERFVASPYFNSHEKCIQLLSYLKKEFWTNQWADLDRIKLEKKLLQGETYNKAYFRIICSRLTQLLEKFIIQKQLEKHDFYQKHFLRSGLIERGAFKYFEQQKLKEEKIIAKRKEKIILKKGKDYYLAQYLSSLDYFKYLQLKKSRDISPEATTKSIQDLDSFFFVHRLYLMNNNLSIQRNWLIEKDLPFFKETLLMATSEHVVTNPLIQFYIYALQLFLQPDKEHWFDKIQKQIEQQSENIPKQELNEFYTILINHYIRKSNSDENYYSKVFELYKMMANYGFLCPEQHITVGKFKNIVTLGCLFQEFNWTKNFIETYKIKILANYRDSVFHFNMGAFYFYQKQFDNALSHLREVTYFDIYYTVDVRSLFLRIYYETEQYFAIMQAIAPFKDFIRKQKRFSREFKEAYLLFITILTKLTHISQKYTYIKKYKAQLLKKMADSQAIFHKKWLTEKIENL